MVVAFTGLVLGSFWAIVASVPTIVPVIGSSAAGGGSISLSGLVGAYRGVFLFFAMAFAFATPLSADRRSEAKAQVDFGIELAQKQLWKEAEFRWEKAVELDPTYASAWNNLGIAYEQQGKFDDAKKAYDKASNLDPKNTFIRQNADMFMEIYERQNRRRNK